MSILSICLLLSLHVFADLFFQSDEKIKKKSLNIWKIFEHSLFYTVIVSLGLYLISLTDLYEIKINNLFYFSMIIFCSHLIIDYLTSKVTGYFWETRKRYDFLLAYFLDQYTHYIILFVSYYILLQKMI